MITNRKSWICSTIDVRGGVPPATTAALEGMAAKSLVWPKDSVLRVRFIDGAPALHQRVLAAAQAWLVAGVRLQIVAALPGQKSQIRVAFNPQGGSWSAVGTDSLLYHPSQPTLNLGWADLDTPDEDFSSVVVHEFGHALGLLHEHNHPEARISWNEAAVNADLSGDPNYWDQKTIDDNVYAAFKKSDVITTEFDKASVMIYTIPPHWTLAGKAFMPSSMPSVGDLATVRRIYG